MKRFTFPLILLVILFIAFLFVINPGGMIGGGEDEQEDTSDLPVLCSLEADDISAFEFQKPEDQLVRIERDGQDWVLVGEDGKRYQAAADKVDKMLEEVPGLAATSIATDKPENQETYEVDVLKGTTFTIYGKDGGDPVTMVVGKAAPGFTSAFVRLPDGPEVYRTNRNVRALLAFAFNDYRSKTPWEFNPVSADQVTIRPLEGGEPQVYTRTDGIWKNAAGANANQNALTELIKNFSELRISQFADGKEHEETGLVALEPQLTVSGSEGTYSLTLGNEVESIRFVQDQDGYPYQIGSASLKFFTDLDLAGLDFDPAPEGDETAAGDAPIDGVDLTE